MKIPVKSRNVVFLIALTIFCAEGNSQNLDGFRHNYKFSPETNSVENAFQFNGYTKYWHDETNNWITYGNLFKMSRPDVNYTIAQSKRDIADDLQIPGLSMQEGFLYYLLKDQYVVLDEPSPEHLSEASSASNVLVMVNSQSDAGKMLTGKLPEKDTLKSFLKSHQYYAVDFTEVQAFILEKGTRKIFVISSVSSELKPYPEKPY